MWIDRFIRGSLLFLLLFTPLAFGTVHAWAYSLMEGVVALMVLAWAFKIWFHRQAIGDAPTSRVWPIALPLCLFIGFVFLQLVPLPPHVLQAISPATYEVYQKALPGWPERVPYADLLAIAAEEGNGRAGEGENGRQGDRETRGQGDRETRGQGKGESGRNGDEETAASATSPYAVDRTPSPVSAPRPALTPKPQSLTPLLPSNNS